MGEDEAESRLTDESSSASATQGALYDLEAELERTEELLKKQPMLRIVRPNNPAPPNTSEGGVRATLVKIESVG